MYYLMNQLIIYKFNKLICCITFFKNLKKNVSGSAIDGVINLPLMHFFIK